MRFSIWGSSLLATLAFAAPDYAPAAGDSAALDQYFQLLASKVIQTKNTGVAPVCDLSNAQLPASKLPPPTGLTLKHVAIGRGTQNYTCSPNNATASPVSIGAVATLYNASCVAAMNSDLLATIPGLALQFNPDLTSQTDLAPASLVVSGHHFFLNNTTPYFNLDTDALALGQAAFVRNASVAAPTGSPAGQGGKGNGSVAWLQLLANTTTATGNLQMAYRVNTAGGLQPTTCDSMPATFTIQYAAEYWFYESSS